MAKKKYDDYTNEELLDIIKNYYKKIGFPTRRDFKIKNNLPPDTLYYSRFGSFMDAIKLAGIEIPNERKYYFERESLSNEELLKLLRDYINKNGIPTNKRSIFSRKNKLPSFNTYSRAFGNDLVYIIELCGFTLTEEEKYILNTRGKENFKNKEEVSSIIYKMQSELNRPLMYDDFRNPNKDTIGINEVRKHFETLNKMKQELGLEIIQDNMIEKKRNYEQVKQDICNCCNIIYNNENRKIITYNDIKSYCPVGINSYSKVFKENNITLRDYLLYLGFELQKEGKGLNHTFDDGEKIRSQYELEFSKYLKEMIKVKYNIDYFRDVRYKEFINKYDGLLDCDYIINYNGRKIYIEIAGLLRDYHKYYYNNQPINSKSKEHYRIKLMEKEKMLKDNNLEYYILFPINKNYKSVMDFDCIDRIFNVGN